MTEKSIDFRDLQKSLIDIQIGILKQSIRDLSSKDIATQGEAKKFIATQDFKNLLEDLGLPIEETVKSLGLIAEYPLISRKSEVEKVIVLIEKYSR